MNNAIIAVGVAGGVFAASYAYLRYRQKLPLRNQAQEKRAYVRVTPLPQMPVEVSFLDESLPQDIVCADISEGGLGCHVKQDIDRITPQASLDINIGLPGARRIRCRVVVRHVKRGKNSGGFFGIEFEALDDEDRAEIVEYVQTAMRFRFRRMRKKTLP